MAVVIQISGDISKFEDALKTIFQKTQALEENLLKISKVSAVGFTALTAAAGLAVKAYVEFERGLVGVGKTSNLAGDELKAFGVDIREMSKRIPVATNELLSIGQIAGQLGVKGADNLEKFTEVIAKLGVSSDLVGEQGATALTRVLNVTGEGIDTIDTFASVIVALGNNFAATEAEIAHMTNEVARSVAVFDVSAAQAAALGTALKSVGVRAELGGSAIGRTFRAIDKAVRAGGESLEYLSEVTGRTGEDLQQVFAEDSVEAFQLFIEGLGRIANEGGDTTAALDRFGLKGEEILKVLPVLAKNSELVGETLALAGKEVQNATALNEEAARVFETLDSKVDIFINTATAAAQVIGESLAPKASELIEAATSAAAAIAELDKSTIEAGASLLQFGILFSGSVAAISAGAVLVIKARNAWQAYTIATAAATATTATFVATATLGLGTVIALLPDLVSGIRDVIAAEKENAKVALTYEDISQKLERLTKTRQNYIDLHGGEELAKIKLAQDGELKRLDDQILKLRELKQAAEESRVQQENDAIEQSFQRFGATPEQLEEQHRIEVEAEKRKQEALRLAKEEAAELERQQRQVLLEELFEFNAESDATLKEQQAAFFATSEGIEDAHLKKLKDTRAKFSAEELKLRIQARKKEIEDKKKHDQSFLGLETEKWAAIASLTAFSANAISNILGKESKAAFAIQQAAAISSAIVATLRGATMALGLGPPHGPILATVIKGLGFANVAAIGAQTLQGFAEGGFAPTNIGRRGVDSVLVGVQPGEFMAPPKTAPQIISDAADMKILRREGFGALAGATANGAGGGEFVHRFVLGDLEPLVERVETTMVRRQLSGDTNLPDLGLRSR